MQHAIVSGAPAQEGDAKGRHTAPVCVAHSTVICGYKSLNCMDRLD